MTFNLLIELSQTLKVATRFSSVDLSQRSPFKALNPSMERRHLTPPLDKCINIIYSSINNLYNLLATDRLMAMSNIRHSTLLVQNQTLSFFFRQPPRHPYIFHSILRDNVSIAISTGAWKYAVQKMWFFFYAQVLTLLVSHFGGSFGLVLPVTSIVIVGQTMANIAKYICLSSAYFTRDKALSGEWRLGAWRLGDLGHWWWCQDWWFAS